MEILKHVILAFHFLGFAVMIGGVIAQIPAMKAGTAKVQAAVLHGSWLMLATGVLLVGMRYALDEPVDNTKITVKLLVLIAIVVIALINKKKETIATWVLPTLGGLTVLNIFLAAIWR